MRQPFAPSALLILVAGLAACDPRVISFASPGPGAAQGPTASASTGSTTAMGSGGSAIPMGAGGAAPASTVVGSGGAGFGGFGTGMFGASTGVAGAAMGASGMAEAGTLDQSSPPDVERHAPLDTCPPGQTPFLLGLLSTPSHGMELREIDPSTGQHTSFPSSAGTNVVVADAAGGVWSAVDNKVHRLYLLAFASARAEWRVVTIDSSSGAVESNVPLLQTEVAFAITVSPGGALLELIWNGTAEELRVIDPLTGSSSPLLNPDSPQIIPGLNWIANVSINTDLASGRWYVVGGASAASVNDLFTIDIATGALLYVRPVAPVTTIAATRDGTVIALTSDGPTWDLRILNPATVADWVYQEPVPGTITGSLFSHHGAAAIDNNTERLFVTGTFADDAGTRLFVMDTQGRTAGRSYPTADFSNLVVACR